VMCAYLSQSGGQIFCTASTVPQRKLSPRASAFPSQQLIFRPAPMSTGEHVGQQAGCDDYRGRRR
ncbi:TPA: hypothetical protein ACLGQQ_001083, partial [Salmonella enterica]